MADIPHLALPFRWETVGGKVRAAEVEQDSIDEITACVEAILRTPYNWRDERPDFGRPELLFSMNFDPSGLERLVDRQEGRAPLAVTAETDPINEALRRIGVAVGED